MIRVIYIFIISLIVLLFVSRYVVTNSSFLNEGIMESMQACQEDVDCIWVEADCCSCEYGGGEVLINKDKETVYKMLLKPLCLQETSCNGEDLCNYEEVYCDRICKFGTREYDKPLLSR